MRRDFMNDVLTERRENAVITTVEKLEKIVGHCEYDGKLHYQAVIPKEDPIFANGHRAYCCVDADACPYVNILGDKYYCRNKITINSVHIDSKKDSKNRTRS